MVMSHSFAKMSIVLDYHVSFVPPKEKVERSMRGHANSDDALEEIVDDSDIKFSPSEQGANHK